VWRAWLGPRPISGYLKAVYEAAAVQLGPSASMVLLTDQNLEHYLPRRHMHEAFSLLSFVHQADYVRGRIMQKYGGVWLDMEALVLQNFSDVLHSCVDDGTRVPFSQSVMGPLPPRSPMAREWVRRMHAYLDLQLPILRSRLRRACQSRDGARSEPRPCDAYYHSKQYPLPWEALLGRIWTAMASPSAAGGSGGANGSATFNSTGAFQSCLRQCSNFVLGGSCPVKCGVLPPAHQICGGRRGRWWQVVRVGSVNESGGGSHVAIGLNSVIHPDFKKLSYHQFLRSPSLFAQAVRRALKLRTADAVAAHIHGGAHRFCYEYSRARASAQYWLEASNVAAENRTLTPTALNALRAFKPNARRHAFGPLEIDQWGEQRSFCHPSLWPNTLYVPWKRPPLGAAWEHTEMLSLDDTA